MRTKIHYNHECPHEDLPLADLRLAVLQARITGSYRNARALLAQQQQPAGRLEQLRLESYRVDIQWSTRAISTEVAEESMHRIISELGELLGRDHQIIPELLYQCVNMYAHSGRFDQARGLAANFHYFCSMTLQSESLYNLALGHVSYIANDSVAETLKFFRHAFDIATEVGSLCHLEVAAVQLALVYASSNRFGAALKCLQDAELPIDAIEDRFWEQDQHQALFATLRWHSFTTPR